MNYNGHNHAIRRLQLELYGYHFTLCHRPGRMLEDANFISQLGEDMDFDPLIRDYLQFARQALSSYPPAEGDVTPDNCPGRRMKKKRFTSDESTSTEVNLASVDASAIEYIEIKNDDEEFDKMRNVPVVFSSVTSQSANEQQSTLNNNYAASLALTYSFFTWCLINPGIGEWLDCAISQAMPFHCSLAIEPSQLGREILQTYFGVQLIMETVNQAITTIRKGSFAFHVQGLRAVFDSTSLSLTKEVKSTIMLANLLHQSGYLKVLIFEFHSHIPPSNLSMIISWLHNDGWKADHQYIEYEYFSDKITGDMTLVFASHRAFHSEPNETSLFHLVRPPLLPVGFQECILSKFDSREYAIPQLDEVFEVRTIKERHLRKCSATAILVPKQGQFSSEEGFQILDSNFPAPLPSVARTGIFSQLFGILFWDNYSQQALVRSVSTYEYVSMFGFSNNFTYLLAQKMEDLSMLRQSTPFRTCSEIMKASFNTLSNLQLIDTQRHSLILNTPLSAKSVLNGVIIHSLPSDQDWLQSYKNDDSCATLMRMLKDPSLIGDKTEMEKVHYVYRARIRDSSISLEQDRLVLTEPTVISDKSIKLIIVPSGLRTHIFTCFHTNPLGGHFSIYQTLHRIRLRYHWPRMYQFLKTKINSCPACILKNNAAKRSTELLYSFPLDAPMNTIHADLWSPGKQTGYEGTTALMIVVCHMTTSVAIEPVSEQTSKSFAKSVYKIMMRYGLASLIVTDPDSKFKSEFESMCEILKIPHHLCSRGNHNAIVVERFNKFLNSRLRIFSNERGTSRVFLEGAETLVYAWNSAPIVGTDISQSLLMTGREFKFPIDIMNEKHITFNINEVQIRSFARDLLDLLNKCREIYKILISEHRALHREYRNSQLSNPRKFNIGDIVFTNVQVQSNAKSGKVKKLSYTRRGPYKITKAHNSGSYDLQSIASPSSATIKKHGSELIFCPERLIPNKPLESSDTIYSELNKKIIPNPYSQIFINGYNPAQPWQEAAAAAFSSIENNHHHDDIPNFPTVQELDNEIDSWPEFFNPFTSSIEETSIQGITSISSQNRSSSGADSTSTNPAATALNSTSVIQRNKNILQPFNIMIQSIIQSRDKLFFIAYSQPNHTRKEWKLVQLDFPQTMKKHSACLQDGKFIVNFLIMHPKDLKLPFHQKRFWIEYHKILSLKQLHKSYHLIQPSEVSHLKASKEELIPYREWVNFTDSATIIHGPFNFATLNNRQTRDKIDLKDWQILARAHNMYQNDPPSPLIAYPIQILPFNEPPHMICTNEEVTKRIECFTANLHMEIEDNIELLFGPNE